MSTNYTFKIYQNATELPSSWNQLAANNLFLSREYFDVLNRSQPENMQCFYVGIFNNDILCGIAFIQFINLNQLKSYGERDKCIKTAVRNFSLKNFASHVLFVGNNMVTGQNAFSFSKNTDTNSALKTILIAVDEIKKNLAKQGKKVHITSYKDFYPEEVNQFENSIINKQFQFSSQPNMVFEINKNWKKEEDYVTDLTKKYRDQYKRARKKSEGIIKRKFSLDDIKKDEVLIHKLYLHVAKNAPFNTFLLAKNHFSTLKEVLKEQFLFYGYFHDNQLIGFNTLIKNGATLDTYFLGYDESLQREKMLYLNMLYDMIGYSIKNGFNKIIFARTALEIKSSIGAKPIKMTGFMEHQNPLFNRYIGSIFNYLEPETPWQERNPFKQSNFN